MKKVISTLLFGFIFLSQIFCQTLTATANRNEVLLGNYLELQVKLENAKALNFETPIFKDFNIVGNNQSSSFTVINGAMSQSVTYTYFLEPKEVGNFFIDPIFIETKEGVLETAPIEIIVSPNPDGIKQEESPRNNFFDQHFDMSPLEFPGMEINPDEGNPKKEKKKKRKTYRI